MAGQMFMVPGKRRFFQLQALISFYVPDFDDRKIWFYGCNCLMDNDRPMSAPGYGKPTDSHGFIVETLVDFYAGLHIFIISLFLSTVCSHVNTKNFVFKYRENSGKLISFTST